ncbi:MAG TPA: putative PEP-binding protein, partial [Phycisphaeraceae bacterium]
VGTAAELKLLRELTEATIQQIKEEQNYRARLEIPVGTMIEVPRAALTADQIAQHADFFSFGTNDLTQMTFGYSRDDVGTFLPAYLAKELLPKDPFQSLDTEGVGQLVQMGVDRGRAAREALKVGICGEHGGDPASIEFCHRVGLDYVSCSPFRVPIARLAAAQAAVRNGQASNGRKGRNSRAKKKK